MRYHLRLSLFRSTCDNIKVLCTDLGNTGPVSVVKTRRLGSSTDLKIHLTNGYLLLPYLVISNSRGSARNPGWRPVISSVVLIIGPPMMKVSCGNTKSMATLRSAIGKEAAPSPLFSMFSCDLQMFIEYFIEFIWILVVITPLRCVMVATLGAFDVCCTIFRCYIYLTYWSCFALLRFVSASACHPLLPLTWYVVCAIHDTPSGPLNHHEDYWFWIRQLSVPLTFLCFGYSFFRWLHSNLFVVEQPVVRKKRKPPSFRRRRKRIMYPFVRFTKFVYKPRLKKRDKRAAFDKTGYEPQFSVRDKLSFEYARRCVDYVHTNSRHVEREVEAIVALVGVIRDCKSMLGVSNALVLYAQRHFPDKALTRMVFEALNDLVVPGFEPQADGVEIPLTGDQSQFMSLLRQFHGSWKMMSNNDGYQKIKKLFSVLTAAGLISKMGNEATPEGLRLFADAVASRDVTYYDVADCIIEATVFFFEGGYECIRTGSLAPLLFGDFDMRRFDELYCNCCKWMQYAQPGNLMLAGISQNDLAKSLEEASSLGKKLMYTVKSPVNKKLIQERKIHIDAMSAKLQQFRASGSLMEKAYCIAIYGKTSVGKSTIGNYLMTTTLHGNDYEATDEYTIVLNESDKYMSNYKSYINGIFLDDIANTKPDFVDGSPTETLLRVVNNIKQYANMAEAELKGKVVVAPKVVVCSSNLKDMGATIYSNEPVSIVRRANVVITATVKPEFAENNQLRHHKVKEYYKARGEKVPNIIDAWFFKVEIAYPLANTTKGMADTLGWKTVCWNGRLLGACDIYTLIAFLNRDSREHFENERTFVKENSNLVDKLDFCDSCKSLRSCCICDDSEYVHRVSYVTQEPQPRERKGKKAPKSPPKNTSKKQGYKPHVARDPPDLPDPVQDHEVVERNAVLAQFDEGIDYISERGIALVNWLRLPTAWFRIALVYRLLAVVRRNFGARLWVFMFSQAAVGAMALGVLLPVTVGSGIVCAFTFSVLYSIQWLFNLRFQLDHALARPVWRPTISREQKRWAFAAVGCSAALYLLYSACKVRQASRKSGYTAQGILHPSEEEIRKIDASQDLVEKVKLEQNWANVEVNPVPTTHRAKTTTANDLTQMCKENTCSMTFKDKRTNAFFLCSNVALVPQHVAQSIQEEYCSFVRHDPTYTSGNFSCWITRAHMVDIPSTDFTVVYVPSGGSWKSLLPYLPLMHPEWEPQKRRAFPMNFGYKQADGTYFKTKAAAFFDPKSNNGIPTFKGSDKKKEWPGWFYTLQGLNTAPGMCMGPLVADVKYPYIAGFHLGGKTGTPEGVAGVTTCEEIVNAIVELEKCPAVFISNSDGTLRKVQLEVNIFEGVQIHPKSSLNRLPIKDGQAPNLKIYGSCIGRAKYFSQVEKTIISDSVEEVCSVPNTWGKPAFHKGDAFAKSLEHAVHSSTGVRGNVLDRAVQDYLFAIGDLLQKRPELKREVRPLSQMENICGIDGKKFIDKLPPNTSIGFPLSGPKKNFMTRLDPDLFSGFSCPTELDPKFWDEVRECKMAYLRGDRCHPVFKACLKDEATPIDKEKVRVFQAAPTTLQLLIREYFLPVVRLLSLFPALSECAVGINCMGPDWQEMTDHMNKFGSDRIVAGDYKKYDLTMPAQFTGAAFKIMIAIAEMCGYTDEELTIMRGIASDVVYPVMAYNGDLIQLMGSNPSGHNLTVYVNSIVNSLLFRCAFYSLEDTWELKFREIVSILTYGDDVKGSVKKGFDKFNNVYLCEFFKQHGIEFTPPDKVSEHKEFRHDHESDFLKRTSQFIPELGMRLGKLNEDSIWKSLHSNIVSKVLTPQQHAAACIDGALREWALYGREKYEMRRAQMSEIAEKHEISHITTMLNLDYDEWVESWQERYTPHSDGFAPHAGALAAIAESDEDDDLSEASDLDDAMAQVNAFEFREYVRAALLLDDETIMSRVFSRHDGWHRLRHIAECIRISIEHATHFAENDALTADGRVVAEWNRFLGFVPQDSNYAQSGRDLFLRLARFQKLWLDPWDDPHTVFIARAVYNLWTQAIFLAAALGSLQCITAVSACDIVPFDPDIPCNGHDEIPFFWEIPFAKFGWFVQQYYLQKLVKRQALIAVWRVVDLPAYIRCHHLFPLIVLSLTMSGNVMRAAAILGVRIIFEVLGGVLFAGLLETWVLMLRNCPIPDKWECRLWEILFLKVGEVTVRIAYKMMSLWS